MLTSAAEEGSTPSPRYHHAASLLTLYDSGSHGASHSFMLVVGGVTQNGVASDTWSLNLSSLIWREHTVRTGLIIEMRCQKALSDFFFSFVMLLFFSHLTEFSAAPSGGPYLDCTQRLVGAVNWGILPGEWLQPPSAGVQPSNWKLDHCPTHWHTTNRFMRPFCVM